MTTALLLRLQLRRAEPKQQACKSTTPEELHDFENPDGPDGVPPRPPVSGGPQHPTSLPSRSVASNPYHLYPDMHAPINDDVIAFNNRFNNRPTAWISMRTGRQRLLLTGEPLLRRW